MINFFIISGIIITILLNIFLILCFREYLFKIQELTSNENKLINIENLLSKIESKITDHFFLTEKNLRDELKNQTLTLIDIINNRLNELGTNLNSSVNLLKNQFNIDAKMNRDELSNSFEKISISLEKQLKSINETQNKLIISTGKKLDVMRDTVDEKLQKTLENRISKSFEFVSKRLEFVHKGIGEMNNLAVSVNDLKKILSNVKTRGIMGEYQLENILSQTLAENQYYKNVVTKPNSTDRIEFALKIPSKNSNNELLLPIDSKFPMESYTNLVDAYEKSDKDNILKFSKIFELSIKNFAKQINNKYIDTITTTDFAIMFLPIESLYSEVSKRIQLMEFIQREYKIIITGPTTLYALLNSLSLAFKTISIEKHSSDVWRILGEIKKEFTSFANILKKTKDKLEQAANDLNSLSNVKTKNIQNKLKNIESLPYD